MAIHSVYWHFLWWHDLGIHCILGNSCRSDKCEEGDEKEKMWAGGETQDRGGKTWQEEDTGKDSLLKWKGMGECSNHHGGCISRSQLGAVLFQSCTNRRNLRRSQGNTLKEAILVLLRSHYEGCFAQSWLDVSLSLRAEERHRWQRRRRWQQSRRQRRCQRRRRHRKRH